MWIKFVIQIIIWRIGIFLLIFEYFEHGHFKNIQIGWMIVLVGKLNFLRCHSDQHLGYKKKTQKIGINPKETKSMTNKWIKKQWNWKNEWMDGKNDEK